MTVALLRLITLLLSIAQWAMSMSQMRAMCEENQKRSSSWKPLKTWQQTCGCAAADCSTVQEEREKQQQLQNCLEGVDDAPQLQQLHWMAPAGESHNSSAALLRCIPGGQSFGKSTRNRNYLRCGLGWIYGNALQPSANQFLQVISFLPHVPSSLPPVWKYAHENNFWTNLI